jgi:hypothetical protein
MNKYVLFVLILCLGVSCGDHRDYADEIIVFDNTTNYPETDLKLSDVADITYIPLKGLNEGYPIGSLGNKGGNIYVDEDEGVIYLKQGSTDIYVYDMSGNPLRKLSRVGRGPQEYEYVASFWVEPETNSIYVTSGLFLLEYDNKSFDFKRKINLLRLSESVMHSMVPLNSNYAIVDNKYRQEKPYSLFSLSDGTIEPCPIELERPYIHDSEGYLDHPALIVGQGGLFMCNMRSDTVRWIDRSGNITPRIVDKTNYDKLDIMAVPAFETDDYVFFSLVFSPALNPDREERMFVFNKRENRIYRVPQSRNRLFALALDECWLTCRNTTLNEDYAVVFLQPIHLIDNIDALPPELKKITETLDENDNPVLALIKLR